MGYFWTVSDSSSSIIHLYLNISAIKSLHQGHLLKFVSETKFNTNEVFVMLWLFLCFVFTLMLFTCKTIILPETT